MTWLDQKPADVVEDAVRQLAASPTPAAREVVEYAGGDLRFALWLHLADKRSRTVLGLGIFDLEDWNWRDAYDDDSSPKDAFADCLEALGLGALDG